MNKLLHTPLTVHNVKLANRLVMPPMATGKTPDGTVQDDLLAYYDARSKGGVTKANEAEALLEEGAADLIGVGRAIFKDADWAKKEMEEYFRGERSSFTLPLSPKGTPFQKKVWEITSTIGYGETKSYGEIAEIMGSKAYRAIGSALGANPLPIVIPCHRVKAKASIGGYSGGLDNKRILLSIEGIKA